MRRLSLFLIGSAAFALAAQDTPRIDVLGTQKKQYSQHDEELIIRDFFQDRHGGYYVDVGCAWPIRHSNTFYLEHRLGWRGVGVDALPDYAAAWKKRRPRSLFRHYAVTDRSGEMIPFYRADRPGVSGVEPQAAHESKGVKYDEIKAPTITLTQLLDDIGVARFDLLSMDIEGGELQALAGFDIDRFKPQLCCIEAKPANREKLDAYFAAHSYERLERYIARDPANFYYAPRAADP